jgi:TM2 domain-containing membrane protein YozV
MTRTQAKAPITPQEYRPGAALLGWIFPGLGHLMIGQQRRGWLIMFGVLFLIAFGLLIGGLDTVDMKQDQLWFMAQAGNGPIAFLLDFFNQSFLKSASAEHQSAMTSLGNLNAIGTLFIALSGLMNIVVILDAFAGPNRSNSETGRRSTDS